MAPQAGELGYLAHTPVGIGTCSAALGHSARFLGTRSDPAWIATTPGSSVGIVGRVGQMIDHSCRLTGNGTFPINLWEVSPVLTYAAEVQ